LINKLSTIFDDIIIVTNKPEFYIGLAHKIIKDIIHGGGPLSGIHAGLTVADSKFSYVIACDMPNINQSYISYMMKDLENESKDACVSMYGQWVEPFNSFYSSSLIVPIEEFLKSDQRAIHKFLKNTNTKYIPEVIVRTFSPDWDMFFNLNTREELDSYLEKESGK